MKLVLATHNRDKIAEIRRILRGLDVDILTIDDFENVPEPVEDGKTLEENALKKAREIRTFTGHSTLADDTGLFVDALGGAPGIYAARYAADEKGDDVTYADNCEKLLESMKDIADARRAAEFRTVMAVALSAEDAGWAQETIKANPDRVYAVHFTKDRVIDALVTDGFLHGVITRESSGGRGFGYDPVFYVPQYRKTLAEMEADQKNTISHRYRALVEMREMLIRLELAEEA